MDTYKIYALVDPRTEDYRYVGQTLRTLAERRSSHITSARRGLVKQRVSAWIRDLLNEGLRPEIELLQNTTQENVGNDERKWIERLRSKGLLLNTAVGSDRKVCLT